MLASLDLIIFHFDIRRKLSTITSDCAAYKQTHPCYPKATEAFTICKTMCFLVPIKKHEKIKFSFNSNMIVHISHCKIVKLFVMTGLW